MSVEVLLFYSQKTKTENLKRRNTQWIKENTTFMSKEKQYP